MMFSKSELEKYLSLCMDSEADFAEIYEEDETSENISMIDGRMEKGQKTMVSGYGIRLCKGVQTVHACSNEYDENVVVGLIQRLCEAIGIAANNKRVHLEKVEYEKKHQARIDFETVGLEEKASLLKRAVNAAKEYDERIEKVQARLLCVKQDVQISNSEGRLIDDHRNRTRLFVEAFASDGSSLQSGRDHPGAGTGLEYYETYTPEMAGREAARSALVNLSAVDCPSGQMPVIIESGFGGVIFHEACGHSLEASAVSKNQSVFAGKLGQKIASDCVSAMDDGTIENAWGSQNIDDEGNFQRQRLLIKDGILMSYMVDRINGRRMGAPSTGSGRRQSYRFETTSRMSNTFILPGESTLEDMLAGIEKGLYARKMGGGSVNPQTGEFNFSVLEGYLIENGKITKPVKGAALIGNGSEILMNIDMVGKNLARAQGMCGAASGSIPTDVGQPAIRVSSITVGGTANE